MEILTYPSAEARKRIEAIAGRTFSYPETHERSVAEIIEAVRTDGDAALLSYTRQFDAPNMEVDQFRVSDTEIARALDQVEPEFSGLVRRAQENITRFHEAQRRHSWFLPSADGSILGQMLIWIFRTEVWPVQMHAIIFAQQGFFPGPAI